MKGKRIFSVLLLLFIFSSGCMLFPKRMVYNEYPVSRDLLYLTTIDAIEETPGWSLLSTDKDSGEIVAVNDGFFTYYEVGFIIRATGLQTSSISHMEGHGWKHHGEKIMKRLDYLLAERHQIYGAGF